MYFVGHRSLALVAIKASSVSFVAAFLVVAALVGSAAAQTGEFNRRATATAQILAGITPTAGDPNLDRLVKLEVFAEHQKWMAAHSQVEFGRLLHDVRSAFHDIFERNYFITDYMNKQLTTPWIRGTVPIMATMMALMNLRIVRIEPIDLYPELTNTYEAMEAKRPRRLMRGVRMDFSSANGEPLHQLYYFSVDAADKALEFYPGFLDWVAQHRPASALLKSASYLLHDNQFEKTRAMILSSADFVIQDDTGIPYRFLQQSPWQVRLYGRYHKPIKGLRYGYQSDLESAYKAKTDMPELPFPFGYHWRGKQSGLIIANR